MIRRLLCKLGFHSWFFIEVVEGQKNLYRCLSCGEDEVRSLPFFDNGEK